MGHDYRELESFVQQQQDAAFTALGDAPSPDTPPPSLYQRALGTGLSEVLASYRGAVLKLEQEILHQPDASMVLAKVHALLSEFMLVLPGLSQLLEHVRSRQLRGGALLRHLTDQCCTGTLPVQTCLKRLLWQCNSQTLWMFGMPAPVSRRQSQPQVLLLLSRFTIAMLVTMLAPLK